MEHEDNEVIGIEAITGFVIQWDAAYQQPYVSGETLEEFGLHNLTDKERNTLGLS